MRPSVTLLSIPHGSAELCVVGRATRARMALPSSDGSTFVVGRSTCPWVAPPLRSSASSGAAVCHGKANGSCLWQRIIRAAKSSVLTA